MRPSLLAFAALLWRTARTGGAFGPERGPIVVTSLGRLRGRSHGPSEEFLGVRYAQQPRRFDIAFPDTVPWAGVRDATSYGKWCWAPTDFPCVAEVPAVACLSPFAASMSEDCLFLDIYRPAVGVGAGGPKAVMVWIHGGGMVTGDSRIYNATRFALKQDVILVSVNYRLGPLGFLPLAALAQPGRGSGGMNGLNDQLVALQWIQRHIAAFGGDPGRVTLFGESAGALSACTLAVAPRAAGLFLRAALASGPCLGPWGPGSFDEGLAVMARAMASAGASTLDDLRALPPWALLWSQGPDQYDIEFPGYWVDGWVAPEHPALRLRAGLWNVQAVLLGGNSRDGVVDPCFVPAADIPRSAKKYLPDMERHWRPRNDSGGVFGAIRLLHRPLGEEAVDAYPVKSFSGGGLAAGAFKAADGDYNVVCPSREIARLAEAANRPAYFFYFTHGPWLQPGCPRPDVDAGAGAVTGWADHGAEDPFVFGNSFLRPNCSFEQEEQELSDTMQSLWASFAKTGVPSAPGLPSGWDRYGRQHSALRLALGKRLGMLTKFGSPGSDEPVDCGFWLRVTGNYSLAIPAEDSSSTLRILTI